MIDGTPGKWNPKVERLTCCSVMAKLPLTVGSMAASSCMRSTRALIEEFSRVNNPRLVFRPRAIASSSDRFNGAEAASPVGVLPLNCANNGRNVHNSVKTALRRVNLCLTPNDIFAIICQ